MYSIMFAPENLAFSVALAVVILLFAVELLSMLIGSHFSAVLDAQIHVDHNLHLDSTATVLSKAFAWLHIGRVPALFILVLFLVGFGLAGLFLQHLLFGLSGWMLPGLLASIPAFLCGICLTRIGAPFFARVMPQDESSAVSRTSFIGRIATITQGTARRGMPAEAKLHDQFDQTHYIRIEPDGDGDSFSLGENVLIVSIHGHTFRAIRTSSEGLRADNALKP